MKPLVTLLLIIYATLGISQSCPLNIDFEKGDFTNWNCFTGTTSAVDQKNIIDLSPSPPDPARHRIIKFDSSASEKDPYGNFPVLCPYGGKYSVKLGNDQVNAEAEGMSYTFIIPPKEDTFTLTYYYAVVFQDPSHDSYEQPRFFVTAYEVETGNVINCASYNYVSSAGIPGFQASKKSSAVWYKNWSPVSIQFINVANKKVRLEFKTADCTRGGHFGYAYLDVGEGCSNMLANAPYCPETNSLILNAPYGFQKYVWYTADYKKIVDTLQSVTLSPPPATSGLFHVDMIPFPGFGCRDTADAAIIKLETPPLPETKDVFLCQFAGMTQLTATGERGKEILWYDVDSGGISDDIAPWIYTSTVDTFHYWVTQKTLFGCESYRKKATAVVGLTPNALFTVNNERQCEKENQFVFTNQSSQLLDAKFYWDFGDKASSPDTSVTHKFQTYGIYNATLKVTNASTCSATTGVALAVIPKPIPSFYVQPSNICEQQSTVVFYNTSNVTNGISTVNQFYWKVDSTVSDSFTPDAFIPAAAGKIEAWLAVKTPEDCGSDTLKQTFPVYHKPVADFTILQPIACENEIIRFRDNSWMPAASTGENIVKWQWNFGSQTATTQHVASTFPTSNYTAILTVESNKGCISNPFTKTFLTHPKPHIQLAINDSCVYRLIKYQAIDLSGDVDVWKWNFGNGYFKAKALVTYNYKSEGNHPLSLIGENEFGCKDTIVRPFKIYDNKAFAGKDTLVAYDQPVQLNAHGGPGNYYTWSPADGMNNTSIENPVATQTFDQRYHLDAITDKGCDAHSDIYIKRFKGPELYIASAFTPNHDGINDELHVFPVGILSFESFSIFDRYGHRIFYTTDFHSGWDGTIKKEPCNADTFIAVAKATDYKGNPMIKTANVMLIR